ncbi:MAG: hypothetical protein AAF533_28780 [Acidobacteriota bacterium]
MKIFPLLTLMLLIAPMANALPLMYCPGDVPCYPVCACPDGVGACDSGTPCCLGSEPCTAADIVTVFTARLADNDGSGGFDESLTLVTQHRATVLLHVFRGGEIVGESIQRVETPSRGLHIDLSELARNADYFHLYVDQSVQSPDERREYTIVPALFHAVEVQADAGAKRVEELYRKLGAMRKEVRIPHAPASPTSGE